MLVEIIIEGINKEIIKTDVDDRNNFYYTDNTDGINHVIVYDDGLIIERKATSHNSKLIIRGDSYIEITSDEGIIKFFTNVIEFNKNFGIITIVYIVGDEKRKITIKYLGA